MMSSDTGITHAVIAANRFGLGARPGDIDEISRRTPRDWLTTQVQGKLAAPRVLADLPDSAEIVRVGIQFWKDKAVYRANSAAGKFGPGHKRSFTMVFDHALQPYNDAQVAARLQIAIETPQPFRERLVQFWSNHFAVSTAKIRVMGLAGPLENEAIRPHVTGNFFDLLRAVEQHPAMLIYLDNNGSVGPGSKIAKLEAQSNPEHQVKVNENLAREILELHTLGVDGGYDQKDVTEFSKAITGWDVGGIGQYKSGQPGDFFFHAKLHEPGTRMIMGKQYAEAGIEQGEAVLRDLAIHPSTAQHISEKLARHFIQDNPSAEDVNRIAAAFTNSGGDLTTVYLALIDTPSAWRDQPAKYKTPNELLTSAYRAVHQAVRNPPLLESTLEQMGQTTWMPSSPAGWSDTAVGWDGADALSKRIRWAADMGQEFGTRVDARALGVEVLGLAPDEHTSEAIRRADSGPQALTLLLASPEFQRR
jgi:uncharacterized protein (DUF1800 family)